MRQFKDRMYASSKEAILKMCITIMTMGISVIASLYDSNSCFATIIVQAINNGYDFFKYVDRSKYAKDVAIKGTVSVVLSVVAVLYSFAFLWMRNALKDNIWIKMVGVFFVAIPVLFVAGDLMKNWEEEEKKEKRSDYNV